MATLYRRSGNPPISRLTIGLARPLLGLNAGHASGYGGNTWAFLQWVLGFRRLGFEVYYVEEFRAKQQPNDQSKAVPLIESASGRYMQTVIERFDLGDHAALLEAGSSAHVGLSRDDISRIAPDIDLFLNQFGSYSAVLRDVRRSIYLDLDPGHTQIWQEQYGVDMNLRGHDQYFTIGLNLGEPDCPLPTCGIRWEKTLWPIVVSEWDTQEPPGSAFTTVANWRDYSWVEWQGTWFAQKAEAFKASSIFPVASRSRSRSASRFQTPIPKSSSCATTAGDLNHRRTE
jgi:hypothetical protein